MIYLTFPWRTASMKFDHLVDPPFSMYFKKKYPAKAKLIPANILYLCFFQRSLAWSMALLSIIINNTVCAIIFFYWKWSNSTRFSVTSTPTSSSAITAPMVTPNRFRIVQHRTLRYLHLFPHRNSPSEKNSTRLPEHQVYLLPNAGQPPQSHLSTRAWKNTHRKSCPK